jgi:uncharacterized membrane protein
VPDTPQEPSADDQDRVLAALSHFSILGGFWLVVPLAIYFVKRESSRFVSFHALQAALLAIAAIPIGFVGTFAIAAVTVLSGALLGRGDFGGFALVPTAVVLLGIFFTGALIVLLAVCGGIKALRGERWSMPILGPLAERVVAAGPAGRTVPSA